MFETKLVPPVDGRPQSVNGPPSLPFLGSLLVLERHWNELPDFVLRNDRKFKKAWCAPIPNIGLLGSAVFSLVSSDNVRHVLGGNFHNYEKGANLKDALFEFLGDGIFTADGGMWRFHRKVASHMFTKNLFRNGTKVAERQLKLVIDKLESMLESSCHVIDMQELFFKMTLDIFASIAFGVELNSVLGEKQHPFAIAFDEVQNCSQKRFKDPFWRLKRFFQLNEEEQIIKKQCAVIEDFANQVINNKRREAENGENMGPDLLSRFLDPKVGVVGEERDVTTTKEMR